MDSLLDVHEVGYETPISRVSWLNPEKNIAILEVKQQWTWEEALNAVPFLNRMVEAQPNPVYTIYYYRLRNTPLFPKGVKLVNLRKLIEIDPPNEQLVIFIHSDMLIRNLIRILSKTYGLRHIVGKYRYVDSWDDALKEIRRHQHKA